MPRSRIKAKHTLKRTVVRPTNLLKCRIGNHMMALSELQDIDYGQGGDVVRGIKSRRMKKTKRADVGVRKNKTYRKYR